MGVPAFRLVAGVAVGCLALGGMYLAGRALAKKPEAEITAHLKRVGIPENTAQIFPRYPGALSDNAFEVVKSVRAGMEQYSPEVSGDESSKDWLPEAEKTLNNFQPELLTYEKLGACKAYAPTLPQANWRADIPLATPMATAQASLLFRAKVRRVRGNVEGAVSDLKLAAHVCDLLCDLPTLEIAATHQKMIRSQLQATAELIPRLAKDHQAMAEVRALISKIKPVDFERGLWGEAVIEAQSMLHPIDSDQLGSFNTGEDRDDLARQLESSRPHWSHEVIDALAADLADTRAAKQSNLPKLITTHLGAISKQDQTAGLAVQAISIFAVDPSHPTAGIQPGWGREPDRIEDTKPLKELLLLACDALEENRSPQETGTLNPFTGQAYKVNPSASGWRIQTGT